jgi:hypothetical protein
MPIFPIEVACVSRSLTSRTRTTVAVRTRQPRLAATFTCVDAAVQRIRSVATALLADRAIQVDDALRKEIAHGLVDAQPAVRD